MTLLEDKGYTSGARTAFEFRRAPGPFVLHASVQHDATADALKEAHGEIRALRGERPVTREELELGRASLTRGYPRNFETADQVARGAAQLALYGLPDDYFSTFVPHALALPPGPAPPPAARPVRPAGRLLQHLRAQGARADRRGRDRGGREAHRSGAPPRRRRRRSGEADAGAEGSGSRRRRGRRRAVDGRSAGVRRAH